MLLATPSGHLPQASCDALAVLASLRVIRHLEWRQLQSSKGLRFPQGQCTLITIRPAS